jgi:DUF971 family protein
MTHATSSPSELRLVGAGDCLEIAWDDGALSAIPAHRLRMGSRSAGAVRAQALGGRLDIPEGLTITGVETVGAYAVRLAFSDGHDRGIYPWRYLRELAAL